MTWVLIPRDIEGAEPHQLGEVAFVGRASDNHIVLDSADVSRHHARVELRDGLCRVADLGSSNGTAVNGTPLKARLPTNLMSGDLLQFGPFAFALQEEKPPEPASEEPEIGESTAMEAVEPAQPVAIARMIVRAPSGTKEHSLSAEILTLGRHPTNDIVIPDAIVSGRHARLLRTAAGYTIEDVGSSNGLWLGGQRVQQHSLAEGDVVMIGKTITIHYYDMAGPIEAGSTVVLNMSALGLSAAPPRE